MESQLARQAEKALVEATQRLSPEERLNAFLTHSRLLVELHEAGRNLKQTPRKVPGENAQAG